jgi:hypothetical protein
MRKLGVIVLFIVSALSLGRTVGAADDVIDLFNGKDLSGWDGDETYWTVEDGVITGRSTAEKPLKNNTFLICKTTKVADFELRLKYKIANGNSGVQYRSKDEGQHVVAGYQADIVTDDPDKYTGILYDEKGRGILAERGQKVTIGADGKKKIENFAEAKELAGAIKKGEWNEYVITARGNHLTHEINGTKTIELIDEETANAEREGILALQIHMGAPMTVQFKDIRLKVLGSPPRSSP